MTKASLFGWLVLAILCAVCVTALPRGEQSLKWEHHHPEKNAMRTDSARSRSARVPQKKRRAQQESMMSSTPQPTPNPTPRPTPNPTQAPNSSTQPPPTPIHPIIPGPAPAPDVDVGIIVCFSGQATVQTKDKGVVALQELKVGDMVLTGSGAYSRVYTFGHYAPDQEAELLQIHTSKKAARPLEMSEEHMVFLKGHAHPAVRADALKVGDTLFDAKGEGATVTKIQRRSNTGVYAPLTEEGTIVVNDVVASSYVAFFDDSWEERWFSQHDYVHLGLSPMRLVCRMTSSKRFCDTYNEDGFHPYVALAIKVNQYAAEQNGRMEFIVLAVVFVLTGICRVLEFLLLDAAWVGFSYFITASGLVFWWTKKRSLKV